ncbi:PPC domain-containing DNA-binding protein [Thermodesulfobacteriota bacterium]
MKSSKVVAGSGKTGRIIAGRILPGNDLLEAFEEVCMAFDVKYGQISTSIGSLRNVVISYVSRTKPIKGQGHATRKEVKGACGLLSGQGIISPSEEKGRMNIHYHAVITDKDNKAFGGHVERGTITLSTCDFIISEMKDISIKREKDPKTGIVFSFFE